MAASLHRLVPLAALAGAGVALLAGGCGGSSSTGTATTVATVTTVPATATTAPPSTSATTPTAPTTPTSTGPLAHAPEPTTTTPNPTNPNTTAAPTTPPSTTATEPGSEERRVHVPATFVARGHTLDPSTITVPPFLAVEVTIVSADHKPHTVVLKTPTPRTLKVAPGKRTSIRFAGLRAGRYALVLDGRAAGTLAASGDAGP